MCSYDEYGPKSKKQIKTKAVKRMLIYEPPRNLVINLKRFTHTIRGFRKDRSIVKFPIHLNID